MAKSKTTQKKAFSAVPKGLKWISWYCYVMAVLIVINIIFSWDTNYFGLSLSEGIIRFIDSLLLLFGVSFLMLAVNLLTGLVGGAIFFIIATIFAGLYLYAGKQLAGNKALAIKILIVLLGVTIITGVLLNLISFTVPYGTHPILIGGTILPAFILYYLLKPEVKSFFAKNTKDIKKKKRILFSDRR